MNSNHPMTTNRKDYGMDYPQESFLERHGGKIGAALCAVSTLVVFGAMVVLFILALPGAVEQVTEHSRDLVAQSRGVEQ